MIRSAALGVLGIAGLLCVVLPANSSGASFDCAKATSAVEKLICSESELSTADEELANIYDQARTYSASPQEFKKKQMHWIRADRDPCQTKECIAAAYRNRIEELSAPSPAEEYYLEEPVTAVGGPEPVELGNHYVCFRVHGKASAPLIDFAVSFPDSGQILEVVNVCGKTSKGGRLDFSFTDGFGNRGKGTFQSSGEEGVLTLEEVSPAKAPEQRNILRNYGTYELTKQACGSKEEN